MLKVRNIIQLKDIQIPLRYSAKKTIEFYSFLFITEFMSLF